METASLDASGNPLPTSACPTCGYRPECASTITGKAARPRPGDLSLCGNCGEMLAFDVNMNLEIAPLSGLMSLAAKQRWQIGVVQKLIRQRGRIPQP